MGITAGVAIGIGIVVGLALAFLTPKVNISGPRADLSRRQTVSPGEVIPEVMGRGRIKGTLLWVGEIREQKKTKKSKNSKSTSYKYYATYAIGICRTDHLPQGKTLGCLMAWRDKKKMWDFLPAEAGGDPLESAAGQVWYQEHVTEYFGAEDQLPDPTIESYEGVGNVPAFRGWAYIVIKDDDITQRGASIPDWEFLPATDGTRDAPSGLDYTYSLRPHNFTSAWNAYSLRKGGGSPDVRCDIAPRVDDHWLAGPVSRAEGISAMETYNKFGMVSKGGGVQNNPGHTLEGKYIEMFAPAHVDPEVTYSGHANWCDKDRLTGWEVIDNDPAAPGDWHTTPDGLVMVTYDGADDDVPPPAPWSYRADSFTGYPVNRGYYFCGYLVEVDQSLQLDDCEETTCSPGNPFETTWVSLPDYPNWCVNQYGQIAPNGPGVIITTGTFKALYDYPATGTDPLGLGPVLESTHPDYDNQEFWEREAARAGIGGTYGVDWPNSVTIARGVCQYTAAWSQNIIDPDLIFLSDIIKSDLAQAGIDAATYLDTTDIDAIQVIGRYVDNDDTPAERVGHLLELFSIDAAAYDGKIVFTRRVAATPVTIQWDEFGAFTPGSNQYHQIDTTRPQEVELPKRTIVTYQAADEEYAQSAQHQDRWEVTAVGQKQITTRVVLNADTGAQIASILHQSQWGELYGRAEWVMDRAWSHITPGDWVTTTSDDGTTYKIRIVEMENQGNGLLLYRGIEDRQANYVSTASGETGVAPDQPGAIIAGPTVVEMLDVPNLTDGQDSHGITIATSGIYSTWPGSVIYRSFDSGSSFDEWYDELDQAPIGTLSGTLAASDNYNTKAAESFMANLPLHHELVSVTNPAFYNRQQLALIGSEVVAFRDAVQDPTTGFWTCSRLLRGLRGTDPVAHSDGERVVILGNDGVDYQLVQTSELRATRVYRGVTAGFDLSTGYDISYQYTGRNMREWSPVAASMVTIGAGSLQISFRPRARINAGFYVQHSDDWTHYEIDILDAPGGNVVRTLTDTEPTMVYTDSQQLADFGSLQTNLDVVIYSVNGRMGRGDPLTVNLASSTQLLTADSTAMTADTTETTADATIGEA